MSLWILIAGTLVGTLLGGLLGLLNTRVQLNTQMYREKQRLILGKLEELHQILSQFKQAYAELSLMAASKAPAEELIKQHSAIPAEKLSMLVGFYAPELSGQLEKIERLSREYDLALSRLVQPGEGDEEAKSNALTEAAGLKQQLDKASNEMQAGVIALSPKYV